MTTPVRARRGDLVMVELRPSYTSSSFARVEQAAEYELMTVRNLTREGQIKMVSDDRWGEGDYQGYPRKFDGMLHRTGRYWLLPARNWDVTKALEIARAHTYPKSTQPRNWDSLEAAREALRPARLSVGESARRNS